MRRASGFPTRATTSLAQILAATLRDTHQVRLTDHDALGTDLAFVESELGHDESTDSLVKDIDAIVHQAYVPRPGEDETTWLDRNSRCIYNLLLAASKAAVEHFVGKVQHWELWNEPNLASHYGGGSYHARAPETYTKLVKRAYRAIKRQVHTDSSKPL